MSEFRQAKSKSLYWWHNFSLRRYANLARFIRNWPSYYAWKARGYRPDEMEVVLRNGFRVPVTRNRRIEFKTVFLRDDYFWPFPDLNFADTDTIIDLGANVGFFTLFAASRFPRCPIVSVEPFPKNAAVVRANVQRNQIPHCQVLERAVSNVRGPVTFGSASTDANPTDARISPASNIDGKNFTTCISMTLDDLINEHVKGDVAMLKMDIEGAEYDALYHASDATFARIKRIALESEDFDTKQKNTEALTTFLESKGFRVVEVTPHMLHGWKTR